MKHNSFARVRRGDRGQALVEFAVILPILLFFLLFIADISFLTYQKVVLFAASRDAARALAVGAGSAAAEDQAASALALGRLGTSDVTWTVEESGEYITVRLSFDRPIWAPGLPVLLGGRPFDRTVPLSAGATFRKRG